MMSERKRKWILGTLLFLLIGGPLGTLNNYSLNRFQNYIRTQIANGMSRPWMPKWQYVIAYIYRYSLRDSEAADAFQQYMELFYEADKDGDKEARERAEDVIWVYPNVLEDCQKRYDSYRYYRLLLVDWETHPKHVETETRIIDLEKGGYQFPPDTYQLRRLPNE